MKQLVLFLLFIPHLSTAQDKKMDLETYDLWNTIDELGISNNGDWVYYTLEPGEGDTKMYLYNTVSSEEYTFDRAYNGQFDHDNGFFSFMIKAPFATLDSLKRSKVKEKDMPKDTLGIFNLNQAITDKIAPVDSYKLSNEYGSHIAFKMSATEDSTLVRKEDKKNGTTLRVMNVKDNIIKQYKYVLSYRWSDQNGKLLLHTTGEDSTALDEIKLIDFKNDRELSLVNEDSEFFNFNFSEDGSQLSFVIDRDSLEDFESNYELAYWNESMDSIQVLADANSSVVDEGLEVSRYYRPFFSKSNDRLYFGLCHNTLVEDSTLLDSEKVALEIWNYKDPLLYPQQKINLKREKERSYPVLYDLKEKTFTRLADADVPYSRVNEHMKSDHVFGYSQKKYEKYISWLGYAYKDLYLYDLRSGERKMIADSIQGSPSMSPEEKYIYWYSRPDTSWMLYDIQDDAFRRLTRNGFYDEYNDRPMHPYPVGTAFWLDEDEGLVIYDEYDLWLIDPKTGSNDRLTQGREKDLGFSYISLDRELRSLPSDTTILLSAFDESNKKAALCYFNLSDRSLNMIEKGPYRFARDIMKAKDSDRLIYTKENFDVFPDLILTNLKFEDQKKISDANPQQSDYAWGSIELFEWNDFDNVACDGMLVKPPNFDPNKKYPLIINFYERSSDRLYSHRAPYPHRSTINYAYWANKGYLILNPDVRYEVGYPGRSCYNAVMSALEVLKERGYVDTTRMGLQGHSWGGYQIADLLTRTDVFTCAESGAPVVNMTSAYGGIRWGSGMSRMFQYERTQSRIGHTIWSNLDLYMENSPLFRLPNVTTPVLILHNDKDGAVPWYQGIEYFVGLRRLGKPAWMLNYVNEPHWPVKRQNRLDFNRRMEQFFDHYLMDAPMPEWMSEGVPALESKTNDGFGY